MNSVLYVDKAGFSSDILNYLKIRPYVCLSRHICFCKSTHPFNVISRSTVFSVCNVLYVCVCASLFLLTFVLPVTSSSLGLSPLVVCK